MSPRGKTKGSILPETVYRQALGHLVVKGDIEMLNLFLKHEVDSETAGCFRESSGGGSENTIYGTALQLAVYTGNFGLTLWLLEHGVHFNGKNQKNNLSALHLATSKRLDDIIGILLTHGADIKSLNDLGETPLHKAASSGYWNIVQLLIDHRANLEAVDRYGQTPLHTAASSRHRDIVQFLLDNKTSTEIVDTSGRTPIHTAALCGHSDIVQLLLDNKVSAEAVDTSGKTPLHLAASSRHRDIVQLLLDYGANIAAVNNHEHRKRDDSGSKFLGRSDHEAYKVNEAGDDHDMDHVNNNLNATSISATDGQDPMDIDIKPRSRMYERECSTIRAFNRLEYDGIGRVCGLWIAMGGEVRTVRGDMGVDMGREMVGDMSGVLRNVWQEVWEGVWEDQEIGEEVGDKVWEEGWQER
ncbi:Similar to Ankyrin-3; acc. no. Q12955 [Pyronema omphalodes CBS 100304]|uniref:Similar to Ankyrin-3 acc. no. Q12955 n=1 Tax=Pyronema omphalodes (strain CBS 100304) TaxID=1076935 RepID=U4LV94_PYROM|nr:Similar to Ankyrin-3; acc. no. Q12955 [Pyronema omphalodes CBS 100304]